MEWKLYEEQFIEKSKHVFDWLQDEFGKLRSGRVTPAVLDHIRVDAYGEAQPIKNIANISCPEPRVIIIKAYDPQLYKDIAAAINASDMGINPQIDADKIRISFPALTEDIRKDTAKKAKAIAEDAKVRIRRIRQDIQDKYKKDELSDDDKKYYNTELDKVTKQQNEKIEKMLDEKTKEVMHM